MSLSSSSVALKVGSNPSRGASHGAAYEPYYGDMLDTIQHRSVEDSIALFSRRGYDVNVEVEYVFDDGKKYNVTPLLWAVRYRKPKLCKYLLDHGARPFNNLVFEYYPLHEACSRGYDDVLKVFIDSKIDLDRPTPDKDTPLHIASMRGHIKCVHLLLGAGADYSLRNKEGRTPVEEAMYQHQDDLIQLFKIYPDISKGSTHDKPEGPRIKRRLSLGNRPRLRQQESSPAAVPYSRPRTVYLEPGKSLDEPFGPTHYLSSLSAFAPATTRSHSHQNLAPSPPIPPKSTAQPHCVSLLSTTSSDYHYTPAKMPSTSSSYPSYTSSGLTQPTLVTQLSIANSCAADSPSPVERDGVGRTLLDERTHAGTGGTTPHPPKICGSNSSGGANISSEPVRNMGSRSLNSSPTKHLTRSDSPYTSGQHATGTSGRKSDSNPPVVYVDGIRPYPRSQPQSVVNLPVTSSSLSVARHQSKLHYRLMESISNPEFPALHEGMVSQEKRTQSSGDLYNRVSRGSVARAPFESQAVSPSREKLNSLSQHIYSSFTESTNQPATSLGYLKIYSGPSAYSDSGGDTATSSHPTHTVVQKILSELGQTLKLTKDQIQSIVKSVSSREARWSSVVSVGYSDSSRRTTGSSSYSFVDLPTSGGEIKSNAESFLSELQVDVEDQPFDMKFSEPSSGYMTLLYHANRRKTISGYTGMKEMNEKHLLLKVVFRVFNLKNWTESSEYHSLTTGAATVATTSTVGLPSNFSSSFEHLSLSRPLQEVAILQKLSSLPHPNIARLVCHFKATTSDKCHMLARNFDPDNPQAVYSAGHVTDYLLVQSTMTTLAKHFENLRKKHHGTMPESEVLVILAQLNLGISHLCMNGVSHCSIDANNVYIDAEDSNRLLLADFARCIEFSADLSRMSDVRSCLRSALQSKTKKLNLCPEVVEWAQELEEDFSSYVQHDTQTLFVTNDSYSAARMLHSLLLLDGSQERVQTQLSVKSTDQSSRYGYPLSHISSLSPQCNLLFRKIVSPDLSERLLPIEAAVGSLMLLFGPKPANIHSIEDCSQWTLAETMQLYMQPVLTDLYESEPSTKYNRLLYVYLIIVHKSPQLLWKLCSLFKHMSV